MKITAEDGEHCWRRVFLVSPEIWIDGVQLHSVIEADDEAGYVVQPQFDEEGRFVVVDGEIKTLRRNGKVSFERGQRRSLIDAD
ncbi:hypothetical protein [Bradyrhizobium sp. WSM1417]|uniref:hypothetical protein n=1 Tax=Bradyrhizobium sp. WSM1417 TaxID=754500 RepID=UPI0004883D34|nr:hypothetical protein [Bradyrhizobium sp. WSM1417]